MGCDIHAYVEVKKNGEWEYLVDDIFPADDYDKEYYHKDFTNDPFPNRNYGLFGFLADVRNYSCVEPLSLPKGTPEDASLFVKSENDGWGIDAHSHSWFTLAELLSAKYDEMIWDKRVTRELRPGFFSGACEANDGEGEHLTLREFLGSEYFEVLDVLNKIGNPEDVRIIFWFDN